MTTVSTSRSTDAHFEIAKELARANRIEHGERQERIPIGLLELLKPQPFANDPLRPLIGWRPIVKEHRANASEDLFVRARAVDRCVPRTALPPGRRERVARVGVSRKTRALGLGALHCVEAADRPPALRDRLDDVVVA